MNLKQISWRLAIAGALGAEVLLVCAAFAWVALYSYLIHPGEPADFYQRYSLEASPWVSALAGVPLFYLGGRWLGSRLGPRAAPTAAALIGVYLMIEAPFLLLYENPLMPQWLPPAGYLGKGLAAYLGARVPRLRDL